MSRKFGLTRPRREPLRRRQITMKTREKTKRYSINKDIYKYNLGYKDGFEEGVNYMRWKLEIALINNSKSFKSGYKMGKEVKKRKLRSKKE